MEDLSSPIEAIRTQWQTRLLILGHYYQAPDVLRHADVMGDSLELSRKAGESTAERIVFCGVHFMAESADILTAPSQAVYMPTTSAGCPMADMADVYQVEKAWTVLQNAAPGQWLPVTYVNSSAAVKAFCGAQGGSTCTSSNAARVLKWAYAQDRRVLFLPDRYLAANTAHDLGVPDDHVAVYDPKQPDGGLTPATLAGARLVAWDGYCPIHMAFTVAQIRAVRAETPAARIIVHPECKPDVVRAADAHGSTAQIIRYVETAPAGSVVYVGTEVHLTRRLAALHRGRVDVRPLASAVCPNMARTNEQNLLAVLRDWPDRNLVRVPAATARSARLALERMLSL
jgi:quinolinate synthase